VILHVFSLFHQNDGALLGRELRDRLVDPAANLVAFHHLKGQCLRFRHGLGCRINFF
jgi:hypothetical protein